MTKEYKRREEKKKEEIRLQREREEQKRRRKEERAAARERHRIGLLKEKILQNMTANQSLEEYTTQMKIFDVRDPDGKKDGIYLIGGFVGELIITFMCLLDYILANPQNQNFKFSEEALEAYLKDLLITENFADGSITLHLAKDPTVKPSAEEGGEPENIEVDDDAFLKFSLTKQNISDYGLCFFLEICKDLVISKDFVNTMYKTIIKIARTPTKSLQSIPEMPQPGEDGAEPPEEEKQNVQKKIEEATAANDATTKENEDLAKIQSKVKINYRPHPDPTTREEVALVRLNNYREPKPEEVVPEGEVKHPSRPQSPP